MRAVRGMACLFAVVLFLLASSGAAAASVAGTIQNGDLEAGTGDSFTCFAMSGWGEHAASLSAVAGRDGAGRAAQISLSGYVTGDRKFMQEETSTCAPAVGPGATYDLSVWYTSTRQANLTVFRHTAAGWAYWTDLAPAPATAAWSQHTATTPAIPDGTDQLAWGLGISGDGTLVVDDFSMAATGDPAPAPSPDGELVVNGTLAHGSPVPTCFQTAGWGDHAFTQALSADVPAGATGRSWSIAMSGYVSGDRKLLLAEDATCAPSVQPGAKYALSLDYKTTSVRNAVTLFRHTASGWQYWTDLVALPATTEWTEVNLTTPEIPSDTDRISFGVSISADGTLLTHGYSLKAVADPPPATSTDPAVVGRWSTLTPPGDVRAMHATLLKDGRVMLLAGSGNLGSEFVAGSFRTLLWNPADNSFREVPTPADMFCAGHVTLPDGKVLVAAGTKAYPGTLGATNFQGARFSHIFDPATDSYSRIGDMADGHWYPTLTKLENGDVWAAGGLNENSDGTVATEMFSVRENRWLSLNEVPQTWSYWGTYPHMYLLADGRMFYSGGHTFGDQIPGSGARIYDWRSARMGDVPGLRDPNLRDQAGSVLLPPAQNQTVMIAGGGHTENNAEGTDKVDIIDLNAANPSYVAGPDLPGGRRSYVNLGLLPDRTVLATGGAKGNRGDPVLSSSTFLPTSGTWSDTADDPVGRGYHSSLLVLQDGRVAVFGGNPADNSWEFRISIYEPPYLFRSTRPTVTAPDRAVYGEQIALQVSGTVQSAALSTPMSATHQTDTNARLIDLPITGTGSTRTATVPANPALVPPGPYMLTVLDADGVPSDGRWIDIR